MTHYLGSRWQFVGSRKLKSWFVFFQLVVDKNQMFLQVAKEGPQPKPLIDRLPDQNWAETIRHLPTDKNVAI